ncbi:hypothetical protein [Croceicoccus mobilis]|uniref:Lipoprotein n=1 Tax=Croceicoccus mobilis TaxID=1703339 RepID=A0A916YT97_9SPHN|nr:hypothetical protein [Croceicoccus mobilis]GGD60024.1 hypothetical protein GCM10010990_06830 [Croceicoccus mobilis]
MPARSSRPMLAILACAATPLLGGCIAKTALDVATLPVRAAGSAVDMATTSQSEADEKRGRELRKREEKLGKLERKYEKQREDCFDGDQDACDKARATYAQIEALWPTIPAPVD